MIDNSVLKRLLALQDNPDNLISAMREIICNELQKTDGGDIDFIAEILPIDPVRISANEDVYSALAKRYDADGCLSLRSSIRCEMIKDLLGVD